MSSTLKGVCASLAVSTALSLLGSGSIAAAQSSGPSITASGCVNRAVNNGSLAGGPGVPSTTPTTAPRCWRTRTNRPT